VSTEIRFSEGDKVRVVEHDDATREPKPGGEVHYATVSGTNSVFTLVDYETSIRLHPPMLFDTGSGWAAAHAEYRWRLMAAESSEPEANPAPAGEE
jgi:hypothetical protein